MDLEKFKEALEADLENPNGYWNKIKKKEEVKISRFPKIEDYINKHGMDKVINILISEHGKEWRDKCWSKGYEVYPNNKFNFLWYWIENTFESIYNLKIPQDFLEASYFVKGYWFTVYCGQGCFYRVYDSNLEVVLDI